MVNEGSSITTISRVVAFVFLVFSYLAEDQSGDDQHGGGGHVSIHGIR